MKFAESYKKQPEQYDGRAAYIYLLSQPLRHPLPQIKFSHHYDDRAGSCDSMTSSLDGVAPGEIESRYFCLCAQSLFIFQSKEAGVWARCMCWPRVGCGCEFPSKNLAGVGVAFYLLIALRAELRKQQWFEQQQIPEPNLSQWLDLVALGISGNTSVVYTFGS